MLRLSLLRLGRWGSRDFMRGRTKRAGAVHTRPTHGSKGHYKRHSTLYSLRDGRRHVSNHLKGGLGIKLGGGLFGLRIPRQHALSTMTREAYELEIYGHPNITNPYRAQLEHHPSLRRVVENATPTVELVVILPRLTASRMDAKQNQKNQTSSHHSPCEGSTNNPLNRAGALPLSWALVGDELLAQLSKTPLQGSLYLATLRASVRINLSQPPQSPAAAAVTLVAEGLRDALLALHREHQKGVSPLFPDNKSAYAVKEGSEAKETNPKSGKTIQTGSAKRRSPLFGVGLRRAAGGGLPTPRFTASAACFARSPLLQEPRDTPKEEQSEENEDKKEEKSRERTIAVPEGVEALIDRLRGQAPEALGLCLRPLLWAGGEAASAEEGAATATGRRPGRTAPARVEPLLKADLDYDERVGVWRQRRCEDVSKLLRWFYASRDPRAHNSDALPHRKRRFSVILLVDVSKTDSILPTTMSTTAERSAKTRDAEIGEKVQKPKPSLMSKQLSEKVERMGFKALQPTRVEQILAAVQEWSVEHQWDRWLQMNLQPRHSLTVPSARAGQNPSSQEEIKLKN